CGQDTYRTSHCIGDYEKAFTLIIQRKAIQGQASLDLESEDRDGPHRLDRDWTKISAFLQDERTAQEKSDEKKATYPFSGIQGQGGLGSDPG
ncbi:hypothetical protein, partial [Thiolapillus sp.]|uniref:hypothetical protein n=1 Tax=Thiolapillus sp. TaxID=2017437 RepID=UPI003AF785C4